MNFKYKKVNLILGLIMSTLFSNAQHFQWADGFDIYFQNQTYKMENDRDKNLVMSCAIFKPNDVQFGAGVYMLDTNNMSNIDFALVKYVNESVAWAYDCPFGIASKDYDSSNNIILLCSGAGVVDVDLSTSGTTLLNLGSGRQFLLKMSASGNYIASKVFNSYFIGASALKVDHNDNIILGGSFNNTKDFSVNPSMNVTLTSSGDYDNFIAKYDDSFNLIWCDQIGGSQEERMYGGIQADALTIDTSNNIIHVGTYNGTCDFDPSNMAQFNSTTLSTLYLNGEAYLHKINAAGEFVYVKTFPSGGLEPYLYHVKADHEGNIVVCGENNDPSMDLDPGPALVQKPIGALMMKFDSIGNVIFINSYASSTVLVSAIAIDDYDNYYFSGSLDYSLDMDAGNGIDNFNASVFNPSSAFLIKEKKDGTHFWGRNFTTLGGFISSITFDTANHIYIYGEYASSSADFDPSSSAYIMPPIGAGGNLFIAKYDNSCAYIPTPQLTGTGLCVSDTLHVNTISAPMGTYYWAGSVLNNNYTPPFIGNSFSFPPAYGNNILTVYDSIGPGCYSSRIRDTFARTGPLMPNITNVITCPGSSTNLIIPSTATGTYYWYTNTALTPFNAGNTYLANNVIAPITYFIKDSVLGGCNSLYRQVNVLLYDIPTLPLVSDDTICAGLSAYVTTNNLLHEWNWFPNANGGNFIQGASLSLSNLQNDTTIYVRDSTGYNCFSPLVPINIYVESVPIFTASALDSSICLGDTTSIICTGNYSFDSNPAALSASGNIFKVAPVLSTNYQITASNAGCSSTQLVTIDVQPNPTPPIIYGSNGQLYIVLNSYASREWYFNGNLIASNTDTIQVTANGLYAIQVSNSSGCFADKTFTVNNVGLINYAALSYQLYNSIDETRIHFDKDYEIEYKLISSFGDVLFKGKSLNRELVINKKHLANGIYYLQGISDKEIMNIKLIVSK